MTADYVGANEAFEKALERIAGPSNGFYTNIGKRVYPGYYEPAPQEQTPYLCVPSVREDGEYHEGEEETAYQARWLRRVFGFIVETSQEPRKPNAPRQVRRLKHDIEKVFRDDPTLGGNVALVKCVGWDIDAGWPMEGVQHGKVELVFEITIWTGADIGMED